VCKSEFFPDSQNPVNCALVRRFTQNYFDSTFDADLKYGCALAWMLFVPAAAPNWMFENVELCLKYRSARQSELEHNCNRNWGGAGSSMVTEKCRPVNKWLTYEDFTGGSEAVKCGLSLSIRLKGTKNEFDRSKADGRLKVPPNYSYEYPPDPL
jgi:hypothetical protein